MSIKKKKIVLLYLVRTIYVRNLIYNFQILLAIKIEHLYFLKTVNFTYSYGCRLKVFYILYLLFNKHNIFLFLFKHAYAYIGMS